MVGLFLSLISAPMGGAFQFVAAGEGAKEPQVAVFVDAGVLAYGRGDDLFVAYANRLPQFGAPIRIPGPGHLSLGHRRGPRVVLSRTGIVISAVYGAQGGGKDGDLVTWRSGDQGKTWMGPSRVNDVEGAAREGLHAMAVSSDGSLVCTWLDLRKKGTTVWAATSQNNGASWGRNVLVYRSPDGHVCECCHPSVTFGLRGEIDVMFRNWLGGSRDLFVARSTDKGAHFLPAVKLGEGTWPLNACPMDGGSLAVDPVRGLSTAWRRDGAVYSCALGGPEARVGGGVQPWGAWGPGGLYLVWEQAGQIRASVPDGSQSIVGGEGERPMVAADDRHAVATWADRAGHIWIQDLAVRK